MNRAILYLATFAVLVLCIESRKPAYCKRECDMAKCPLVVNCECGTYVADRCECCQSCRKCPGEQCSIAAKEMCSEGYRCKKREGTRLHLHPIRKGTCVENAQTAANNLTVAQTTTTHITESEELTTVGGPANCTGECETARCAPVDNCQCGTYSTGSCESCRKCPGEQCNMEVDEACSEGYMCKQGEGLGDSDRSNKNGTCVETEGPHPQAQLLFRQDQNDTREPFKPKIKLLLDVGVVVVVTNPLAV